MPKISVIVPVYNVEKYLEKCIDSLISQTLKDIEIILVDDGSLDNSGNICDEYAKKDKRIKVIHQKNKGLSGARNVGVENSVAEWYTFVDSDDYLLENGIETLNNAKEDDIDLICTRTVSASRYELNNYPYEDKKIYCTTEELRYLKLMLLDLKGNNNSSCGKLYSKKFTDKYNLFHNEKLRQGAEDLEFNFRVFSKAKRIKILYDCFYKCGYNSTSITRSFNIENEYLKVECFKTIKFSISNDDEEMMGYFYNRLLCSIISSAISGFFNPNNKDKFKIKKQKYIQFLKNDLIKESLEKGNDKLLDSQRKFVLFCIKNNMYHFISAIARLRMLQKRVKNN